MKRPTIVVLAGVAHFAAQMSVYVIAFAMGPRDDAWGAMLYRLAQALTFPFVWLAERRGGPPLGFLYFAANSALWAGLLWLVLRLLRLPRVRGGGAGGSRGAPGRQGPC